MIKKFIKTLFLYFCYIVYLPHIIAFMGSKSRKTIEIDIKVMISHKNVDYVGIKALVYILSMDKFYRAIFYTRIGGMFRFCKRYVSGKTHFYPCKNIGEGIYVAHPYSTVLNAKAIGKYFSCRQCTTIGNKFDGRNDLVPTIGDHVTLGANVVIIGNVHIGNNVIVGAGSVVVKDIPDNCVVAGNPAMILKSYNG